jgi:hypothetical protein
VTLNGQLIAHFDPCPENSISTRHLVQDPGTGNGWVEAAQWDTALKSPDNIDYLYGYWTVPAAPKTSGALVYFFNGVEPNGGGWIIQPVLQYGDNGAFGGDYWVFASWLVHSNTDYFVSSTVLSVNPGDKVNGSLWVTSISGDAAEASGEYPRGPAAIYIWLGDLSVHQSNLSLALQHFQRTITLLESPARCPGRPYQTAWPQLSYSNQPHPSSSLTRVWLRAIPELSECRASAQPRRGAYRDG